MSPLCQFLIQCIVLGTFTASAQTTIFNQNFDGGYTGAFGINFYAGGSPTGTNITQLTTGGNPNGCLQVKMTSTTSGDSITGQAQLMTVSGNADPNPANYVLSFDAKGSQATNIQFIIQSWQSNYFGGSQLIQATVNDQLTAANIWQTFRVNLGTVTTASPTGATWQLEFQINASQWGGVGHTDTLTLDNLVLTHLVNGVALTSSANPSALGAGLSFTATIMANGVTAGNATGQVVFSTVGGPFSTNTVAAGSATSASIASLPAGNNVITAVYSGGNYPASTNTLNQFVSAIQSNLSVYTDNLVNGFQNWSWATVNLQNQSPAPHSGTYCVSVTDAGNQALAVNRPAFNTTPYTSLSFWINGGTGGQHVQVQGLLDDSAQVAYPLAALSPGWQQVTIPLSSLQVANNPNCRGFWFKGNSGSAQATFYVDDIQLVAAPLAATVHLGVDAAQTLATVDARQFGLNTATWDNILGSSQTLPLLQQIGCTALRWPGGSTSDDNYHWASDSSGNSTFQNLATNLGAQVFTTVNYGTGTASEAAGWVRSANQTNHCNFKYWEIGNECYGSWEKDTHPIQHDPYSYATNAVAFIQQMKAAYTNFPVKVGIVVVPGEGSFSNNATHFVLNPRTGTTNYGWTPIVLSQMKTLGVLPDFLIYHFYYQYTPTNYAAYSNSPDSDPLLLQAASNPSPLDWSDWASAASDLRQQLTDYIGSPGTNIELCVTENNSDAGTMGRQSTSLVNALYLADSTSQLIKTEFRSYIWWDLHNGASSGDFDPTLYGWRSSGDYGILDGGNVPFPTFYAEKLLQSFARPGDSVLNGTSDNLLLSAYAVHRTNGALTMLVINKHMTTNLTGQISLTNFVPSTTATIQSYGIPQDQAAQNNSPAAGQDVATNSSPVSSNFTYVFPPLSLTLFTFSPGPSTLSVLQVQPTQVQLQLQGQPGAYVIQSSLNLSSRTWNPVSTNALVGTSANINIPVSPGAPVQFYRAAWQP